MAVAAGAPGLALAAGILAVLVLAGSGWHPVWSEAPLTLSEAVALRDEAAAVRLIAAGADPNEPSHVRAGVVADTRGPVPPLEAAVRARRPEMVGLLFAHGARVRDPEEYGKLLDLAEEADDDALRDELVRRSRTRTPR